MFYIPDTFKIYDDRCREESIELNKNDIVFIDDKILLVKIKVNDEITYVLIDILAREVLTTEFESYYVDFFNITIEDYIEACDGDESFIKKNSYLISKDSFEKAGLRGSGYQDALEKIYSNIRKQVIELKKIVD